jgi:hypothetical protein
MNKILSSGLVIGSLVVGLIGCNSVETGATGVVRAGETVADTGILASERIVQGSVDTLVGLTATAEDMVTYKKKGVVYHHGRAYHIKHGKYVLAHK